jgi:hypothetical protein
LVFLSGCRTGEAQGDTVSMAEKLARLGVPAVLGWGRPVRDHSATQAAPSCTKTSLMATLSPAP